MLHWYIMRIQKAAKVTWIAKFAMQIKTHMARFLTAHHYSSSKRILFYGKLFFSNLRNEYFYSIMIRKEDNYFAIRFKLIIFIMRRNHSKFIMRLILDLWLMNNVTYNIYHNVKWYGSSEARGKIIDFEEVLYNIHTILVNYICNLNI